MFYKKAFTLAEVLSVLVILGVVAAITIPTTIKRAQNRQFVTTLLKNYAAIESATEQWMIEEGCVGDIRGCFANLKARGIGLEETEQGFKGIADKLNVMAVSTGDDIPSWLTSEPATLLNGSKQTMGWQAGSSKIKDSDNAGAWYLLKDGSVLFVQFPDDLQTSGFGFIDVNGKKGPNRVGKDVFPLGWGASGNSALSESRYFNPYFTEDQWSMADNSEPDADGKVYPCDGAGAGKPGCEGFKDGPQYVGLCRISCAGCLCQADEHSPTAYVLKNKKLPKLSNIGYPD